MLNATYQELDSEKAKIFNDALALELANAIENFPNFPKNPIFAVAIMAEEAGEAVRAANLMCWDSSLANDQKGAASAIQQELIQTAAMCFRAWMALEGQEDG